MIELGLPLLVISQESYDDLLLTQWIEKGEGRHWFSWLKACMIEEKDEGPSTFILYISISFWFCLMGSITDIIHEDYIKSHLHVLSIIYEFSFFECIFNEIV